VRGFGQYALRALGIGDGVRVIGYIWLLCRFHKGGGGHGAGRWSLWSMVARCGVDESFS